MEFHDICPSYWADFCHFSLVFAIFTHCFMSKETYILSVLTHLQPEMSMKNGQIPPDSMTCPYRSYLNPLTVQCHFRDLKGWVTVLGLLPVGKAVLHIKTSLQDLSGQF